MHGIKQKKNWNITHLPFFPVITFYILYNKVYLSELKNNNTKIVDVKKSQIKIKIIGIVLSDSKSLNITFSRIKYSIQRYL